MRANANEDQSDPGTARGQQSNGGISRRQALGSAAAGAAGVALGSFAQRAEAASRRQSGATVDVVVIGGGISGLTAAYRLLRTLICRCRCSRRTTASADARSTCHFLAGRSPKGAASGRDPDRTGCRRSRRSWGSRRSTRTHRRVGVRLSRKRQTHTGTLPPLGPPCWRCPQNLTRLDQMANTVPLDAPWQAPTPEWDAMTFGQWLMQTWPPRRRDRCTRSCFRSPTARTRTPPRCCSRYSPSTPEAGSPV